MTKKVAKRLSVFDPAKIRKARQKANLSQRELSEMVGVHQTAISHAEHGRRGAANLIEEIAKATKTSIPSFLYDDLKANGR